MRLKGLQSEFLEYLYQSYNDDIPTALLANIDGDNIAARLGVYQNNLVNNLYDAMKLTYPVIYKLVGDRFFRHLAMHYRAAYKSKSGNLDDYGHELAYFLKEFPATTELGYLADVAHLEWNIQKAYDCLEQHEVDSDSLLQIPVEAYPSLRFVVECNLVYSSYPIAKIWEVNQDYYHNPDEEVDLGSGECFLVVYKDGYKVELAEVNRQEFRLLEYLKQGKSLYKSYQLTCKDGAFFDIGKVVTKYIKMGIFNNYYIGKLS